MYRADIIMEHARNIELKFGREVIIQANSFNNSYDIIT